jgi:hypothetical protein
MSTQANTLIPIELDPKEFSALPFSEFVEKLLAKLHTLKNVRFTWYDDQRRRRSRWVNGTRKALALVGALAILLTALAGLLRILGNSLDVFAIAGALVLYAIMGAISFYENVTADAAAYFRQVRAALDIRDLWTKLQFEFLKELMGSKAGDSNAEALISDRLIKLAEAFCNDLDKITSSELVEWRTEFMGSLSELESTAKKGTEDSHALLQNAVKAYENAAAESRAAARAANEGAKPGYLNLEIIGDFDQVVVFVDDKEVARTHLKKFGIDRLMPGYRKIQARATKKGAPPLEAAQIIDIKPGLQAAEFELA